MHALENYFLMQHAIYSRRGDHRIANEFKRLLPIVAEYIPADGAEPEAIQQLNVKVSAEYWFNKVCDEMLAFIRRKRRVTITQLRAHFRAFEQPEDEYPPPDYRVLQRALASLVRQNLIRRYGHGAYAMIPARERVGPSPG